MALEVVLNSAADRDLDDLSDYISERSGEPGVALRYVSRLRERCARLALVPEQGSLRRDLGTGIRLIGFDRRVAILFRVRPDAIEILRILYGGRDLSAGPGGDS